MEQEIDLRPYIEAVISKWYWILGIGIVAAVIAYIATSYLLAPSYEATALVAITDERQTVQFDPRIDTQLENQPKRVYPEIAMSDEIMTTLLAELGNGQRDINALRNQLQAEAADDPGLLRLKAVNNNATQAAETANTWSRIFVDHINRVYGDQGGVQLLFFEEQLATAEETLVEAENALIELEARNPAMLIENELLSLHGAQADLLAKKRQINLLLQDVDSLLAEVDSSDSAVYTDALTNALLRVRAFGGLSTETGSELPLQIQINIDEQSTADAADRYAFIGELRTMLTAQVQAIDDQLSILEPELLALQERKQSALTEQHSLMRNFELAEGTYTALSRTVEEKRITSQNPGSVRLASQASVPRTPIGPRTNLYAAATAVLAMLGAVLVIVMLQWWTGEIHDEATQSPPTAIPEEGATGPSSL